MKNPPEKIYLQWTDDPVDPYDEFGITWCVDRINDGDIEYVKKENDKFELDKLTMREIEVLVAYIEHGMNKTAAQSLGITRSTFKNHCTSIYRKLGVNNITQAVVLAFRSGIVK